MVRLAVTLGLVGALLVGPSASMAQTCDATVVEVGGLYIVHDQRDPLGGHMSEWVYEENGRAPGLQRHDQSCFTLDPLADDVSAAFVGPY